MWKLILGRIFALTVAVIVLCAGSESIAGGEPETSSQPEEELLTPDQFFVAEMKMASVSVHEGLISDFEICCVFFYEKMKAVEVVVNDFERNSLGNIHDYGFTVGETSDLYMISVAPRYYSCRPEEAGCLSYLPYKTRARTSYFYELNKHSLKIEKFYVH